jgi:hypothetical protein
MKLKCLTFGQCIENPASLVIKKTASRFAGYPAYYYSMHTRYIL